MALDGIYGNSPANLPGPVPGAPAQPAPSPLPNASPPAGIQQLDLPGQGFTAGAIPTPAIQPPVRPPGSMIADEPNRAPSSGSDVIDFDKIALEAAEPEGAEANFHYTSEGKRDRYGRPSRDTGSVRLMFKPDGGVMYRPLEMTKGGYRVNEKDDWKPLNDNDALTQAFTEKLQSVGDLVNSPSSAVGAGASLLVPVPGLGPVTNAVLRTGLAAAGSGAAAVSGIGEWTARQVLPQDQHPFLDYYLQQNGKQSPWQAMLFNGVAQGAFELGGGIFSRFAAENRAKSEQIARSLPAMQAGVSDEMAAQSMGIPITPGMAVGTRPGGGAVQRAEISLTQNPRTSDLYHDRMQQIAQGVDQAYGNFKSKFAGQVDPKAISITEFSRDSIGKNSNMFTRNLEAQMASIAGNRERAQPYIGRETIDPKVVYPFIEAIFSKEVPSAVVNGRLDMKALNDALEQMGGIHSGAQTDILKKMVFWRNAAEGSAEGHGLASSLEQELGPVFPDAGGRSSPLAPNQYGQPGSMSQGPGPVRGSSVQSGEAQLNLSAAEIRPDTSSQIPGQTDAQKTLNPVQNPGRPGVDIGSQQNTPMGQDQLGLPGSQTRWKLPSFQEFADMHAKRGVNVSQADLGRLYEEFISKATAARAILPNGAAGPKSRRLSWNEFVTEMNSVQGLAHFDRAERNKIDKLFGSIYRHMNTLEAETTAKALEEVGQHDLANKFKADSRRFNESREALMGMKNKLADKMDYIGREIYKADSYDFKMMWNVMSDSERAEAKALMLDGILRDGIQKQVTPGNTTLTYGVSAPAIYRAAFEDEAISKNMLYAFGKKDFQQLKSIYNAANAYELHGQNMSPAEKEKFIKNLTYGGKRIFGLEGKVAHFLYSLVPASDAEAIKLLNKRLPELIEKAGVAKAKADTWAKVQGAAAKSARYLPGVYHLGKLGQGAKEGVAPSHRVKGPLIIEPLDK